MKPQFVYDGQNENMLWAVKLATEFFASDFHLKAIEQFPLLTFAFSTVRPFSLYDDMKFRIPAVGKVKVVLKWRYSKSVLAWVTSSEPRTIYINSRNVFSKFNEENICGRTGTLVHEMIHVLDHASTMAFGHAGNSSIGKQLSAPYWYGSKGKEFARIQLAQRRLQIGA